MARHSKWHNIKHKKALKDAKKSKIFTIHAKLIAIAAHRWWWDIEKNKALQEAIYNAKAENVPNANIERAIKRWTWELKDGTIEEILYEWYWAWWVAVIVKTLTDNRNRTAPNIRHIFSKYSWNLWESGSVNWIFSLKWVIYMNIEDKAKLEDLIFETDVDDYFCEEDFIKIITKSDNLYVVKDFFLKKGLSVEEITNEYIPNTYVNINNFDKLLKFTKMREEFEDDDDVESFFSNIEVDDNLQKEVDKYIEARRFKT